MINRDWDRHIDSTVKDFVLTFFTFFFLQTCYGSDLSIPYGLLYLQSTLSVVVMDIIHINVLKSKNFADHF